MPKMAIFEGNSGESSSLPVADKYVALLTWHCSYGAVLLELGATSGQRTVRLRHARFACADGIQRIWQNSMVSWLGPMTLK